MSFFLPLDLPKKKLKPYVYLNPEFIKLFLCKEEYAVSFQ